jgi:GTP-binding protein YchF
MSHKQRTREDNNMRVGIVGLPGSGKTTLFRALTRGTVKIEPYGSDKPNIGVVSVPDERIDFFAREYNPKKVTYASIEFVDGAARIHSEDGKTRFGSDFFQDVRQVDALVNVVRGFITASGDKPNAIQDVNTLNDELLLADLQQVETRMQRVEKQTHGLRKGVSTPATIELELLERVKSLLESGKSLKTVEFAADEERTLRGYDFLTMKPVVAVLNIAESDIGSDSAAVSEFREFCNTAGIPQVALCAELERQVSELPDDEETLFLQELGIGEPARNVLIRECYKALGLISFITAGEPEVRAWTLKTGSKVIDAAATIHSDLARGFIRAEVANAKTVMEAGGWEAAKAKGIVELHGKDYLMHDGDVIYIRFKV